MATGKQHSKAALFATLVTAAATYTLTQSPKVAALVAAGALSGLVLTPDLDVDSGSISFSLVRMWFGKIAGSLWEIFWWPYARLIPHRHPISHMPVLGTAIRLIYIGWIPYLYFKPDLKFILIAAAGLVVSDALHYIMDL